MDNLFLSSYIVPNYVTDDCILLNKDCRDILNCIKRESIDLFCSDIPYRIAHKGGGIKKDGKKYMSGMFNSYDDTNENKDNIRSGKVFTHNNIKISEYIKEVYCILKERKSLLFV